MSPKTMVKSDEQEMIERRQANLDSLLDIYPPQDACEMDDTGKDRYLLVERSVRDGSYFCTVHHDPRDAASYHDCQEYPEDWSITGLFDLNNGAEFYPEPATTFHLKPTIKNAEITG